MSREQERQSAVTGREEYMKKGSLYVISGPSGTGKGTIIKGLVEGFESVQLSVSMTTRPEREGEVHGTHYYFVTREEFEKAIAQNGLLEYANVYGNYYGTPRQAVEEKRAAGIDVVLEIDVQGAMKVKEACPDAVMLFILPPSLTELRHRLVERHTDAPEVIEKRMKNAAFEIGFAKKYDYALVNADLDKALAQAKAIVQAERLRVGPHTKELIDHCSTWEAEVDEES